MMKENVRRRWIYIVTVLLVLMGLLMIVLPKADTVRLSVVFSQPDAQGNISEMILNVPESGRLKTIYLRGRKSRIPSDGEFGLLLLNGKEIPLTDFAAMPAAKGEEKEEFENKKLPLDIRELRKLSQLTVSCHKLPPAIQHGDLELVIELEGDSEIIKDWGKIYKIETIKALQPEGSAQEQPDEKGSVADKG